MNTIFLLGRLSLRLRGGIAICCLIALSLSGPAALAAGTRPVVHAVLFYSPVCPHCRKVITKDLPPILKRFGKRLDIIGVNSTTPAGQALFQSAIQAYNIPKARRGVPTIIVWNYVLVGPAEIEAGFSGLIESFLKKGGAQLPPIPGLKEQIAKDRAKATARNKGGGKQNPAVAAPHVEHLSLFARVARDPVGNSLAIAVLAGMLVAFGSVVPKLRCPAQNRLSGHDRLIPALCLTGLAVSAYLSYVEIAHAATICGPVGNCNLVQQSPYSRLFGIFPVSFAGLIGYAAMIWIWALTHYANGRTARTASTALLAAAFLGTIFSIYLTFLEPFVIGAACLWCLTSAAVMTALLWFSANRFRSVALLPGSTAAVSAPAPRANPTRPGNSRSRKKRR